MKFRQERRLEVTCLLCKVVQVIAMWVGWGYVRHEFCLAWTF